jgi:thiosulfate/3-mercaptopyruvate sulfurtransferase
MSNDLLIEASDLNTLLQKNEVLVIDCRFSLQNTEWGREEYYQGHVPGAYYAHLDDDLSSKVLPGRTGRHPLPTDVHLQRLIRSWGVEHDSLVVVYDQSAGGVAARAWWLLKWAGVERVRMLDGGWTAWQRKGLPISDEIPPIRNSEFVIQPGGMPIVGTEEVGQFPAREGAVLIDTRARERYLGEDEPLDPVAGHIPGALNLPWMSSVLDDGYWRDIDEIRTTFDKITAGGRKDVAMYCGSGVTACHLAFAYELAGLGRARIYPGSWSEWITDVTNPVATGEE